MVDAFDEVWNLRKTDFVLGPMPRSRRGDFMGISYGRPRTYKYRVPIGKDPEGKLIYGPREHEVADTSFVDLSNAEKNRGKVVLNNVDGEAVPVGGVMESAEDWGPWPRPPPRPGTVMTLDDYPTKETDDWVSGRGIINTIAHEALHDADPVARWTNTRRGRPTFGARKHRGRGPVTPGGQFEGVQHSSGGATTRDSDFAAETLAYLGSFVGAPGKANIRTMRHPDVDKVDTRWLLNRLAEARKREGIAESDFSPYGRTSFTPMDSPEEILARYGKRLPDYVSNPKSARDIRSIHAEDTLATANFTVPKSQQIRRNLINAVNEMAMTRMIHSGEFFEDPITSPDQTETSRNRPSSARMKRMKRETKDARAAINRHWKKVEAGKAPVPNSMEDLPENIQRLIGQQQIRAELGMMRGRASEALELGDPAELLGQKLAEQIGHSSHHGGDSEQRKKWDKMPFEEQEAILRDYLTELSGMMREEAPTDRWYEPITDYEWSDNIHDVMDETKWERRCYEHDSGPGFGFVDHSDTYQRKCTGDMKSAEDSETGCDGHNEPLGLKFRDLREEFPHIFGGRGREGFAYRGTKPGKKHQIVPHRYTPPPGIPEQDWLEMLQWASDEKDPISTVSRYDWNSPVPEERWVEMKGGGKRRWGK